MTNRLVRTPNVLPDGWVDVRTYQQAAISTHTVLNQVIEDIAVLYETFDDKQALMENGSERDAVVSRRDDALRTLADLDVTYNHIWKLRPPTQQRPVLQTNLAKFLGFEAPGPTPVHVLNLISKLESERPAPLLLSPRAIEGFSILQTAKVEVKASLQFSDLHDLAMQIRPLSAARQWLQPRVVQFSHPRLSRVDAEVYLTNLGQQRDVRSARINGKSVEIPRNRARLTGSPSKHLSIQAAQLRILETLGVIVDGHRSRLAGDIQRRLPLGVKHPNNRSNALGLAIVETLTGGRLSMEEIASDELKTGFAICQSLEKYGVAVKTAAGLPVNFFLPPPIVENYLAQVPERPAPAPFVPGWL